MPISMSRSVTNIIAPSVPLIIKDILLIWLYVCYSLIEYLTIPCINTILKKNCMQKITFDESQHTIIRITVKFELNLRHFVSC